MLEQLKEDVYRANLDLVKHHLVIDTWGNASAIDRDKNLIAIKPSGVDYSAMKAEDMVITDLEGNIVSGQLRPSSDLLTHIEIYKAFSNVNGVVHTHSTHAVAWAQAGYNIPCYGTTHADYFYGDIPCSRSLTPKEIEAGYEKSTGLVIAETFNSYDYEAVPAVVCRNHGPFSWGKDVHDAVHNAMVLEEIAKIAFITKLINPSITEAPQHVQDKHYFRKHGKNAYYGQK